MSEKNLRVLAGLKTTSKIPVTIDETRFGPRLDHVRGRVTLFVGQRWLDWRCEHNGKTS